MRSPPLISIKTCSSSLISHPHAPASIQPFLPGALSSTREAREGKTLTPDAQTATGYPLLHSSPSTVSFFPSENASSPSQGTRSCLTELSCPEMMSVFPHSSSPLPRPRLSQVTHSFLLSTVFSLDDGGLNLSLLQFALNVSGTFSVLSTKTIGLQKSRLQRMQPEKYGSQASLPPVPWSSVDSWPHCLLVSLSISLCTGKQI